VELGYFGRLGLSVATSDYGELAWGVSGVIAQYDPAQTLAASVVGADVKYKWAPGRNTSLQIESELLWNRHETAAAKDLESWGGYAYLDYRFRQRFNVGAIAEMAEGAFEPEVTTRRVGLFLGFAPVEETSVLRLAGDWTEVGDLDGYWSLTLQLVFGLGPHQAHTF
jgi:hypothetical protein